MTDSVLLVHDDPAVLRSLGSRLEQAGAEVVRETSVDSALRALTASHPDVVCIGVPLAEAAQDRLGKLAGQEAQILAFGSDVDPGLGGKLMNAGVNRILDPADQDRFISLVRQSAAEGRRRRVCVRLATSGSPRLGLESLGTSSAMKQLAQQIGMLAQNERTTLLISGEPGAGKAWAARIIHDQGVRAGKPFFEIRLTGHPAAYLESAIFGHEKGAFIEASARKHGLLELADGGTLVLRDIGAMPAELQPKLLRAVQSRQIRRVGGQELRTVDVRVISATHVDLARAVRDGAFREDLYYRLNVVTLVLPPLRERGSDIELLAEAFLVELAGGYGLPVPTLTVEVRAALRSFPWPGNVRELRNAIERGLVLSPRGTLLLDEVLRAPVVAARSDQVPFPATLQEITRAAALAMLDLTNGNKSLAARRLGISRPRLQRILEGVED